MGSRRLFSSFTVFLTFFLLFDRVIYSVSEDAGKDANSNDKSAVAFDFKAQRQAIKSWASTLSDEDYDVQAWKKQPQYLFEDYTLLLSDQFKSKGAKVNFALVGACDGTHDKTITERYLPFEHWRGVFVEPFEINFQDLKNFMIEKKVLHRTHLIHGAATYRCNSTTIKMKRPTFEEKNKSLPHWMRREIGAVVPFDKLDRPATGGWTFEFVRCLNGQDVLKDWSLGLAEKFNAGSKFPVKVRPHVLKVDVEGHDYEVLMGFISDDVPPNELPLLISFEAKSITKKFDLLRAQMEKRGYVVSNKITNDGLALLKAEVFFNKNRRNKKGKKGDVAVEQDSSEEGNGESMGKKGRRNRRKGGKRNNKNQD